MVQNSIELPHRLVDQILRWPTPRSEAWTLSLLGIASSDHNIIAIVAAGSTVRPNVSSSDLDLVVICEDSNAFGIRPPIEIDLRVYSEADVEKLIAKGHDLLSWALKFGKVLYERNRFWHKLVMRWRRRLPLPSAQVARERAATAIRHLTNLVQSGDIDAAREQALSYMTHIARAELLDNGIYPTSRPELPSQLRMIRRWDLAEKLDRLISGSLDPDEITTLVARIG